MGFQELVVVAQKHFPNLNVKYKDQSKLMKFLGFLLFFNKKFMTSFTTTIGSTIYFPNKTTVDSRPASASIILLHEIVHINDAKKISAFLFSFLYLTPQILSFLLLPLFFLIPWWAVLLMMIVLLSPLPSFFRMLYEKRAYIVSLYVTHHLSIKLNFSSYVDSKKAYYLTQFKSISYYFMWPFTNLEKEFDEAVSKIKDNQHPFDDPIFDIIDELMQTV